ncbi:TraR/DksA family transcriptional regulator [Aquitalea sp. S1-19]|nr:TraR/DksA family transcriptional regulator [Aquitalea sp. S1-19]
MTDMFDRAQELEEAQRMRALQAQALRGNAGSASLLQCQDCGEDIPEARRRAVAGCRRCVDCQSAMEAAR